MKKALCMILALTMIFSLVGCGKSEDEKTFKTKKDDVIEPYLDEEGNFVSSLSEFVVEPDKYFPKSTVETNSEDDGSRIMVYVEFCTQEEIDTYAEKAKGERFVKMSYSDTDGKMWDDSKGWYSFAVMTEESGDDDQPLNCLFIYLINSDFAYDLKHPKVEETPVPTVDPTPEPTPEPVKEKDIRWDVIREYNSYLLYSSPVFSKNDTEEMFEQISNMTLLELDELRRSEDFKNSENNVMTVGVYMAFCVKLVENELLCPSEDADDCREMLLAIAGTSFNENNAAEPDRDLTDDERELLENIWEGTDVFKKIKDF